MAKRRGTPLWVTVGCGCVLLVGLVIGGVVAAGYFGISSFQGYIEDMKDPAARTARAAEILGTDELPEGYAAQMFLSIPWILDFVVLSDGEPVTIEGEEDVELEAETLGEHMCLYFKFRKGRMEEEEIERMLRGEATSDGTRTDLGLELDSFEELARGSFEIGEQSFAYAAHRGELDFDDGDVPGVYSRVIVDCPGDTMTRVAVWFRRDPEDPEAETPADLAGSPADEGALQSFMGHFDLCRD